MDSLFLLISQIPIMEEWWTKTRAALLETNITRAMITEMTGNTPLRLRLSVADADAARVRLPRAMTSFKMDVEAN